MCGKVPRGGPGDTSKRGGGRIKGKKSLKKAGSV